MRATWSPSTTPRCATARSARASRSRSRTSCASRPSSTLLGVHYVEGGFPGSNPKDIEFFERARDLKLEQAVVSAFGSTRRKDTAPEDDPGLQALLDTGCEALCIFGKSWDVHVTETLQTTLEENVRMVRDSVAYLKAAGRTVFFDAEHFFDGYKADADLRARGLPGGGRGRRRRDRAVRHQRRHAAARGAAHRGRDVARARRAARHPHPQRRRLAVANSLIAVEAGCTHVQGTINGYGERAGNADLIGDHPGARAQDGRRLRLGETSSSCSPRSATSSPRPRTSRPTRTSPTWARARSRTRAACTRARSRGCPRPTSTSTR